jgi:hypothetical protein
VQRTGFFLPAALLPLAFLAPAWAGEPAVAPTGTANTTPGARAGDNRGIIIVGGREDAGPAPTTTAPARPSTVIVGGGTRDTTPAIPAARTPATRAASQAAAETSDPDSLQLLCRGGPHMQWREFDDYHTGTPMLGVIFQPTPKPVTPDGASLGPSECGIVGFTDYLPPAIQIEKSLAGNVREELTHNDRLWLFQVKPGHGYVRASSQRALGAALQPVASPAAPAADAVPANLFQLPPRTPLVIAGRKTTAGEQQRVLREAALANAGPAQRARRSRAAPAATASQTAPAEPASANPAGRAATQIQGMSNQPGARQAAELQMDCVRNAPRISNTAGAAMPGQRFSISGSCFGAAGRIELRGNLPAPDTVLTPAVLRWTDRQIEMMVPGVARAVDQSVTVAVVRADGQRSLDRAFPFKAPRERHRVPAERWQPTSNPSGTEFKSGDFGPLDFGERNEFTHSHIRSSRGYSVQGTVVIDTACELQDLEVNWRGRQLFSIQKWDDPPEQPYIGRVLVTGAPSCTTRKEHTLMISGEYQHTCSFSAEFIAWASCPVGFRP